MTKTKLHEGIAIIEVADPILLTEIENDPVIQPYLGERLSDRCIAVLPQAVGDVQRRLQALNHIPTVVHNHMLLKKSDQAV